MHASPRCLFCRPLSGLLLLTAALTCASSAMRAATPLRSPWDAQPVAVSQVSFDCGPIIPVAPDISVTGNLSADNDQVDESVKAAAYAESTTALHDLTRRVVSAADHYQHSGSQQAAECVATQLTNAAENHAFAGFMGSEDTWQEQNKALHGVSIAFLKVRPSGLVRPDQERLIVAWMSDIVHQERKYYETGRCDGKVCGYDGHRGLAVAFTGCVVGVAGNDHGLFRWCVDRYHHAVDSIDGRGMMHYDTRGRYAFKWNLESAANLVEIAEFGETNGDALYSYDNGRIHLLVHTVSRALIDPSPYQQATKDKQKVQKPIPPWEVTWASVYDRRFPDPVITSLLQQVGPASADMWGGEPWGSTEQGTSEQ